MSTPPWAHAAALGGLALCLARTLPEVGDTTSPALQAMEHEVMPRYGDGRYCGCGRPLSFYAQQCRSCWQLYTERPLRTIKSAAVPEALDPAVAIVLEAALSSGRSWSQIEVDADVGSDVPRMWLYRPCNPRISTVRKVANALGLDLVIVPSSDASA